jgi:hypothetical protein
VIAEEATDRSGNKSLCDCVLETVPNSDGTKRTE